MMQVLVQGLGHPQKACNEKNMFTIEKEARCSELVAMLNEYYDAHQKLTLIYQGKLLNTLTEAKLIELGMDESSVNVVEGSLALLGGAKKRKKKAYTTPKRIKHKRKKVAMSILTKYKVDGDKLTRLLKECGSCEPGTFLANHKNRSYCGKCHFTESK